MWKKKRRRNGKIIFRLIGEKGEKKKKKYAEKKFSISQNYDVTLSQFFIP